MPNWTDIQEIVARFNADAAQLGPQFTSVCAIHDALSEQTATQGVGLLDPVALLQLFASMVDTAAAANQWTVEQVDAFLTQVSQAVARSRSAGDETPWPIL